MPLIVVPNIVPMKNLLLTALMIIGFAGTTLAAGNDKEEKDNKETGKVSQQDAGQAVNQWQFVAGKGESNQYQGMRKSLFFSADNAQMLAQFDEVAPEVLSKKMTRKLSRKYKGYQISRVVRYQNGQELYLVTLQKDQQEVFVNLPR